MLARKILSTTNCGVVWKGFVRFSSSINHTHEKVTPLPVGNSNKIHGSGYHLSPLFSHGIHQMDDCKLEIVDSDAWKVSSDIAEAWKGTKSLSERITFFDDESVDEATNSDQTSIDSPDFDEIEDMRIRGSLFYKLERDSKEYDEYTIEFHRRNASQNKNDKKNVRDKKSLEGKSVSGSENGQKLLKLVRKEAPPPSIHGMDTFVGEGVKKERRTLTFNQMTDRYHEPFCLDIFISKASVRACIIHRETSKVVVVAHSISKDMKFDLSSTRNKTACFAIGEALAQRALADDIHNVVYTPRKEEKLEGKLQTVLHSIIDNGVNVKVKLKQWKMKKAASHYGLEHQSWEKQ
ncbi:uncharacterized protein LOC124935677 [Impatiens glandulifera]|uniref:uncharacterized protein LOC124935677 n=1 Tax=Impatiens glandulifera TaxID=253017 RepID=UPI001FB153D2|nr:uncharacterized protein LOC124935677 [Impatiens glandulifera]